MQTQYPIKESLLTFHLPKGICPAGAILFISYLPVVNSNGIHHVNACSQHSIALEEVTSEYFLWTLTDDTDLDLLQIGIRY